ncbi:hypothetical protein ACEWY4_001512 [Coilia grayii]|uniref:Uncharacterized protein n=1 Tax=Coilia grayii TaxID=363190 RepID=A0ABD1KT54_9TELE
MPMLPFLADDLFTTVKHLLQRFVKDATLERVKSPIKLFSEDFKDAANHKEASQINIGFVAEKQLKDLKDEIQSAHWNQSQITIFTAVAWIKKEVQSYVVVSDELQHDKNTVTTFLTAIVKDLQETHPGMRELYIFSDGSASQFKNRYVWFFLASSFKEMFPNVNTEWHYFATSHGKGAVDGVGGTVKRAVGTAVLSRQVVLLNAGTFAETARRVCPKMEVLLITKYDITEFCLSHQIDEYWHLVAPLPDQACGPAPLPQPRLEQLEAHNEEPQPEVEAQSKEPQPKAENKEPQLKAQSKEPQPQLEVEAQSKEPQPQPKAQNKEPQLKAQSKEPQSQPEAQSEEPQPQLKPKKSKNEVTERLEEEQVTERLEEEAMEQRLEEEVIEAGLEKMTEEGLENNNITVPGRLSITGPKKKTYVITPAEIQRRIKGENMSAYVFRSLIGGRRANLPDLVKQQPPKKKTKASIFSCLSEGEATDLAEGFALSMARNVNSELSEGINEDMAEKTKQTLQKMMQNAKSAYDAESSFSLETHSFGPQALSHVLHILIQRLDNLKL